MQDALNFRNARYYKQIYLTFSSQKYHSNNFGFLCQLRIRDSTQSTSEHVSQKKVKIAEHGKVELVLMVQFW